MPFSRTEPEVGRSSPAQRPSKVVLPLPEGPRIEQVLPAGRVNEMSLRTVNLPAPVSYVFVRCWTSRIERALINDEIFFQAQDEADNASNFRNCSRRFYFFADAGRGDAGNNPPKNCCVPRR